MMKKAASVNKGIFAIAGMAISFLLVVMGILVMCNVFGGDTYSVYGANYPYDSGYATFGNDYYTYVCNNTGEAGSGAIVSAQNLDDIAILLKNVCGIFLIGFGLLSLCVFTMKELEILQSAEEAKPIAPSAVTACEVPVPTYEPTVNDNSDNGSTLS